MKNIIIKNFLMVMVILHLSLQNCQTMNNSDVNNGGYGNEHLNILVEDPATEIQNQSMTNHPSMREKDPNEVELYDYYGTQSNQVYAHPTQVNGHNYYQSPGSYPLHYNIQNMAHNPNYIPQHHGPLEGSCDGAVYNLESVDNHQSSVHYGNDVPLPQEENQGNNEILGHLKREEPEVYIDIHYLHNDNPPIHPRESLPFEDKLSSIHEDCPDEDDNNDKTNPIDASLLDKIQNLQQFAADVFSRLKTMKASRSKRKNKKMTIENPDCIKTNKDGGSLVSMNFSSLTKTTEQDSIKIQDPITLENHLTVQTLERTHRSKKKLLKQVILCLLKTICLSCIGLSCLIIFIVLTATAPH
jgi:hypothetical protein